MKILRFGAIWCPECVIMKPRWEKIEKELPWLKTEFIDIEQNPEMKKNYHIDHIPTYVFLSADNQEIVRLKGLLEVDDLLKIINEHKDK